jgi:hypothetical protein
MFYCLYLEESTDHPEAQAGIPAPFPAPVEVDSE